MTALQCSRQRQRGIHRPRRRVYDHLVRLPCVGSSQETVDSVLDRLKSKRFSAKKMFGEYAIYADGKVVALVCDDRLYVKVHAVTEPLSTDAELAPPYPGAKPHYVLDEGAWAARDDLSKMLTALAGELPPPKKRRRA